MGHVTGPGGERLRHAFDEAHKGGADLQKRGNLRAVRLLLGHTKMDGTVRYLGVDIEDALSLSEGIDLQPNCRPAQRGAGRPIVDARCSLSNGRFRAPGRPSVARGGDRRAPEGMGQISNFLHFQTSAIH